MNKEMKNNYDKALKLYHEGELKKSLEICEVGISKNLKNNSLLNLKGLILYLKGDLEGAITVWKINRDFNEDEMSKTYIRDAENDEERKIKFEKAKILIKDLHINEAIEILNICRESDFNSIQVNNALALCEFRRGECDKSRAYIHKSLLINKRDTNALAIKKELDEFTEIKGNKRGVITLILLSIIVTLSVYTYMSKGKVDKLPETNNIVNNNTNENNFESNVNEAEDVQIPKENEIVIDEKVFTMEEIEKAYIDASTYFAEENYLESKVNLEKIVKQSAGNHLNNDILFLLGSTYEKLDDKNNSIKYFEEYISLYENGDYIEEVYYKLALQYESIDIEKSKEYANELIYNYPESIYNNTNIDSILEN